MPLYSGQCPFSSKILYVSDCSVYGSIIGACTSSGLGKDFLFYLELEQSRGSLNLLCQRRFQLPGDEVQTLKIDM